MAEGTYEYECMRAELLGIEKPDYDEFVKNHPPGDTPAEVKEEEDVENLQEVDHQDEQMKNISSGLDEINSILKSTQKKIHSFKAHCGSLTNLLRFKVGSTGSSTDSLAGTVPSTQESSPITSASDETPVEINKSEDSLDENSANRPIKSDLGRALDKQVDKLDRMIEKAENAQYSMSYQTKEMKKFLNK